MKIWLASMECAGISEAGGVKDVTLALCKGYAKEKEKITLFIPAFGCTSFGKIENLQKDFLKDVCIDLCCKNETVSYSKGTLKGSSAEVIFVNHPSFQNKYGVYVYTEKEQAENPAHVKGQGHEDSLFLDALFSKAVIEYLSHVSEDDIPDIIHCQDASTAVIPAYLKNFKKEAKFSGIRCVVTIHNAGPAYHHEYKDIEQARYYTGFSYEILDKCKNFGRVEPFLLGATNAHLTTVSSFYAQELVNPDFCELTDGLSVAFSERNIKIEGITNGIDYEFYSPENPEISLLPFAMNPRAGDYDGKLKNRNYLLNLCTDAQTESPYLKNIEKYGCIHKPEEKPVYFMYHGRAVWQKGLQILLDSMDSIIGKYPDARFLICCQGDPHIEDQLKKIALSKVGKVVYFNGYNPGLSRLLPAASDFIILPSLFEPCGLEDFIAQIYGTLPIAHSTGGLNKIIDGETGFLFKEPNAESLSGAVDRAMNFFYSNLQNHISMSTWAADFIHSVYSWDFVIETKYLKFFQKWLKEA